MSQYPSLLRARIHAPFASSQALIIRHTNQSAIMQKLIDIISKLVSLIFSGRDQTKALQAHIEDQDKIIADLRAAHEADDADDASLEKAAVDAKLAQQAAEGRLAAINADIQDAQTKADALAASITDDPAIPLTVNPATGAVTPQ